MRERADNSDFVFLSGLVIMTEYLSSLHSLCIGMYHYSMFDFITILNMCALIKNILLFNAFK